MARKNTDPQIYKIIHLLIGLLSFIGGLIVAIGTFSRSVATIPYVDQRHDELIKYVEARAIEVRQQAFDHADMNKKDTMGEIKAISADIRAMGSQQNVLLDAVRTIQQQLYDRRR